MFNKTLGLLAALLCLALCLTGCAGNAEPAATNTDVASQSASAVPTGDKPAQQPGVLHTNHPVGYQLEAPAAGEKAAVLHTNYGDIYIRLFPEVAPKAVENFTGLIEKGYYNGLTFHRVINGFCVQGGDPKGDGTGGESLWNSPFEDEFCSELLNIKYAVAMANSGVNTNGSQFFIDHATDGSFDRTRFDYDTLKAQYDNAFAQYVAAYDQYVAYYGDSFKARFPSAQEFAEAQLGGISPLSYLVPEEVWKLYEQQGGNINLDGAWRAKGGHTVFGQVYQGTDVVDAIAGVAVDSNDKPTEDVVIQSAEIITVS